MQRQMAMKRIVLQSGLVGLSLGVILSFCLHQRTDAAERLLPTQRYPAVATEAEPKLASVYAKLPLSFEANQGQIDTRVRFLARGSGYTIFLTDDGAVLTMRKSALRSMTRWRMQVIVFRRRRVVGGCPRGRE